MPEDVTRDELTKAFDTAVNAQGSGDAASFGATAALPDNLKDFFCKNWNMIKQVLQFLGDRLGGIAALVVKGLIAVGDVLHGKLCP